MATVRWQMLRTSLLSLRTPRGKSQNNRYYSRQFWERIIKDVGVLMSLVDSAIRANEIGEAREDLEKVLNSLDTLINQGAHVNRLVVVNARQLFQDLSHLSPSASVSDPVKAKSKHLKEVIHKDPALSKYDDEERLLEKYPPKWQDFMEFWLHARPKKALGQLGRYVGGRVARGAWNVLTR